MKLSLKHFLLKSAIVLLLFVLFRLPIAISLLVVLIPTYRYIVAFIFGLKAMPIMDIATFLGTEESRVNVMSSILFERQSNEKASERFKSLMSRVKKTRYAIVEKFGDMYYKELPLEEAFKKVFLVMPEE